VPQAAGGFVSYAIGAGAVFIIAVTALRIAFENAPAGVD
jgi:hypothetical protein